MFVPKATCGGKPAANKAGTVINPRHVRAQMEGGTIYGLSNALYGAITAKDGAVVQDNFPSWRLMRMGEAPRDFKVEIIASAVSYMAGYNIRLLPINQSMAQLDATYGREVARTIQGRKANEAVQYLTLIPRKSAALIVKTLKSAIANAENNNNLSSDSLTVKSAIIENGPVLKRFKAGARGTAMPRRKKSTSPLPSTGFSR